MGRGASQKDSPRVVRRRLFRAGSMQKAAHYDVAQEAYEAADTVKPKGRVGRLEGLFCSLDIKDLATWVRVNLTSGPWYDATPNQLTYEGPEPWVYPVYQWNVSSGKNTPEAYREYWESGMLLSDFEALLEAGEIPHIWTGGAEVLVDPQCVKGRRNVSQKRLLEAAGDDRDQLKRALKQRSYAVSQPPRAS